MSHAMEILIITNVSSKNDLINRKMDPINEKKGNFQKTLKRFHFRMP